MREKGTTKRQYSDAEKACSVYGLRAKDAQEYFYIGSTKFCPQKRFKQHLDMVRLGYNENRHFVSKVRKIGAENIICELIEEVTEEGRFEREYFWIAKLISEGVKLTNIVVSAETYKAGREMDEYLERVSSPDFVLAALDKLLGGPDPDPSGQSLAGKFHRIAWLCATELLIKRPEEFKAFIMGEKYA